MASKKPKKGKSHTAKKVTAALAAAGLGMANVLGRDEKHIELRENSTDLTIAIANDAAIVATNTASTTLTFPAPDFNKSIE